MSNDDEKGRESESFTDRFMFFRSYYDSLKELSPEELKQVFTAICEKAFYDKDIELTGYQKALYLLIEPVLLKSIEKSKMRSEQGKKGGRPKTKKANESKTKANESNLKAEKEKEKEKEKGEGKRIVDIRENMDSEKNSQQNTKRFTPPSLEEVSAYCRERKYRVNPESFIDYYSSNGWRVGNNSMDDWKAAVRLWEHRIKEKENKKQNHMMTNHYTSEDFAKLEEQLLEN